MAGEFVLDNSVSIRWALLDGSAADRAYADQVLDSLHGASAQVPALWYTETVHVLRGYENDGKLGESALAGFVYWLGQLPISLDAASPAGTQLAVAAVSREFKLSGYDAQYLELAKRKNLPIATLDKELRKAAKKTNVPVFLIH
ncbi:MAG: VapC toxin family PIN domain ribonuclease [Candidimonas sp.]|nr:MAG: VapC toxin family PIN domain ribonuclease [Candidimonas sp.]TAM21532.1 MAG: VapC toxin family PIN domain ribonuclease [Candidimonas sp.]TAM77454.1 MAG: VapC toxin family PIN domain ribonuclease [Candidimonas sp.]